MHRHALNRGCFEERRAVLPRTDQTVRRVLEPKCQIELSTHGVEGERLGVKLRGACRGGLETGEHGAIKRERRLKQRREAGVTCRVQSFYDKRERKGLMQASFQNRSSDLSEELGKRLLPGKIGSNG